jgi:hypothetical protein
VPWRGPERPGDVPTLGYEVADFIQDHCVIPDGRRVGEQLLLTDEMIEFLLAYYRVDPDTDRFFYTRGAQLVRAQKWGKSPFGAAIICAEAVGPVRFGGWNAEGQPVGEPVHTPWIQVASVSEDSTDNVWGALIPMIDRGELSGLIPDTGLSRINLPGGGRIEPVTSAADSRLGARLSFCLMDETHLWTTSHGGQRLSGALRRNLAGMGGRWLETTNAWNPQEESVAQRTAEKEHHGVYFDDVEPGSGSIRNKQERRRMLRKVYGDSASKRDSTSPWEPWVDLDRIDDEIVALLGSDPTMAERFFLNRKLAGEDAAFPIGAWDKGTSKFVVPERSLVVMGVDGARFVDALAVVATHIETGFQWPVGIWERPELAGDDYEHPMTDVDGAVMDIFERFDVWRVYIDPQWIDTLVDKWQGRWGEKRVVPWYTNRPKQAAFMVRNYVSGVSIGDVSHNRDEVMARHVRQAKKQKLNVFDDDHRQMWTLSKDRPDSPRKIDAAMAGAISWEARGDAIAAGATKSRSKTVMFL